MLHSTLPLLVPASAAWGLFTNGRPLEWNFAWLRGDLEVSQTRTTRWDEDRESELASAATPTLDAVLAALIRQPTPWRIATCISNNARIAAFQPTCRVCVEQPFARPINRAETYSSPA
ncbi:hypothetical protein BKA61DRAFT_620781 [Leptodontidium sp. MPI-SDFR-AT-0119]|nr:hypothetical protein BKA61DRAFT_620781 [Leptodontidium sp. MPI-SDFR-AT-0119]